jgi:hypothetical protein
VVIQRVVPRRSNPVESFDLGIHRVCIVFVRASLCGQKARPAGWVIAHPFQGRAMGRRGSTASKRMTPHVAERRDSYAEMKICWKSLDRPIQTATHLASLAAAAGSIFNNMSLARWCR